MALGNLSQDENWNNLINNSHGWGHGEVAEVSVMDDPLKLMAKDDQFLFNELAI
jgi:hypothetical protein